MARPCEMCGDDTDTGFRLCGSCLDAEEAEAEPEAMSDDLDSLDRARNTALTAFFAHADTCPTCRASEVWPCSEGQALLETHAQARQALWDALAEDTV